MIPNPVPRRIVSLVPSLTETVVELGLRAELVGCTSFCVEPPSLHRDVVLVGGTKDFAVERVLSLQPTHVVANQEENTRELVEALRDRVSTLVTFPRSPADVPPMIRSLGTFLGCPGPAAILTAALEVALNDRVSQQGERRRFLYLIWRDPYMIAGPDTYISRLLAWAGWQNAYQGSERYPALSTEQINALRPDHIFLSSEPFAFRTRHIKILGDDGVDCQSITKIDGRLCSWFGYRTLEALSFLRKHHV
ncbi:MAG: cobalamin-binding protein [Deltaproteobacteria bacterium]|nr:cobalamin-binding protein [Deltaproteobacteria bacterium]